MITTKSKVAEFSVSGNVPVGDCCCCELTDTDGNILEHIDHYTLYKCQNPKCSCWCCEEHFAGGLCYGCFAEQR